MNGQQTLGIRIFTFLACSVVGFSLYIGVVPRDTVALLAMVLFSGIITVKATLPAIRRKRRMGR